MLTREDLQAIAALMDERLNPINARMDKMDERFEKIDERFDKMDERFEKIDERFEKIDKRFEKIDERFEKIDERFDRMDERLDGMEGRLDRLETQLVAVDRKATETRVLIENEVGRAIKLLGEGHQGILDSIQQLVTQDQLEETKDRVFALEEGFKEQQKQIRELQRKTS